jgi:hypothetical protein
MGFGGEKRGGASRLPRRTLEKIDVRLACKWDAFTWRRSRFRSIDTPEPPARLSNPLPSPHVFLACATEIPISTVWPRM